MNTMIRMSAATGRTFDRSRQRAQAVVRRSPLVCVWTNDPPTGRPVARWTSVDASQSLDDRPLAGRSAAARFAGLRVAA